MFSTLNGDSVDGSNTTGLTSDKAKDDSNGRRAWSENGGQNSEEENEENNLGSTNLFFFFFQFKLFYFNFYRKPQ